DPFDDNFLLGVETRAAELLGNQLRQGIEQRFHARFILSVPNHVRAAALAGNQSKGIKNDRLTGAGLTGNDVQSRLELENHFINHGEVPDAKLAQHITMAYPSPHFNLSRRIS